VLQGSLNLVINNYPNISPSMKGVQKSYMSKSPEGRKTQTRITYLCLWKMNLDIWMIALHFQWQVYKFASKFGRICQQLYRPYTLRRNNSQQVTYFMNPYTIYPVYFANEVQQLMQVSHFDCYQIISECKGWILYQNNPPSLIKTNQQSMTQYI
jgi:hypothetical protein